MSQGYIKLHRQLQQHSFWQEPRQFSKAEAWIDLLFMANHKDNKFLLGNEFVEVKRGSFITSELKLMERWKWSKSKVRAFLELLQSDEMIVKKTDHKKTALTIVNYGTFQDSQTIKEPVKDRQQTANRPRKDTNNNDKNGKNEKKLYYADDVYLTEKEYMKLLEQFDIDGTNNRIERLSLYKGSTGKKYASDYLTILSWERKNKDQQKDKPKKKEWEPPLL